MGDGKFRMGRLDHVHIRVPDREVAARWYAEHLGFEPVERFEFWAKGFEGGPLQISADGGRTMLALFETGEGHPMVPQKTGVAFSMGAEAFMAFARSLPGGLNNPTGSPLQLGEIVDFDMCWAFNLADPWGNQYELNCYDYERVKVELIQADGVEPVRYWPSELYADYRKVAAANAGEDKRETPHVPAGWPAVVPRIAVDDPMGLVRFIQEVFDAAGAPATERPTELRIGDALIMVGSTLEREPMTAFLYVYVEDVDTVFERAAARGAVPVEPPRDMPYGDRRAMLRDAWGNLWQVATHGGAFTP